MEKISILPDTPGAYMYFDKEGTVIYVGKAKNLKRRVSSYFNRTHDVLRTNLLVRNIADMKYIVVPTEQDAPQPENSMIKEYKPRYNVPPQRRQVVPWIVVTNELYPRVFLTRQHVRDGSEVLRPPTPIPPWPALARPHRPSPTPVRTCRHAITPEYIAKGKGRLCLQYHIRKCRGCCTGAIDAATYGAYIDRDTAHTRGETQELLAYLREQMEALAAEMRFEGGAGAQRELQAPRKLPLEERHL